MKHIPIFSGVANMFSIGASNKAGLEQIVYSAPVIIDTTNPLDTGSISCPSYVQVGLYTDQSINIGFFS